MSKINKKQKIAIFSGLTALLLPIAIIPAFVQNSDAKSTTLESNESNIQSLNEMYSTPAGVINFGNSIAPVPYQIYGVGGQGYLHIDISALNGTLGTIKDNGKIKNGDVITITLTVNGKTYTQTVTASNLPVDASKMNLVLPKKVVKPKPQVTKPQVVKPQPKPQVTKPQVVKPQVVKPQPKPQVTKPQTKPVVKKSQTMPPKAPIEDSKNKIIIIAIITILVAAGLLSAALLIMKLVKPKTA